jgi:HPr kinase/phosphorylase
LSGLLHLHASCVEWEGLGILLTGVSGSGKSTLTLQFIEAGARLVADDRVTLDVENGRLSACAPVIGAGMLEMAGFGVIKVPESKYCPQTLLCYEFHLTLPPSERLPEPETVEYLGIPLQKMKIPGNDPMIGNKAIQYLAAIRDGRVIQRLPVASAAKSA